MADDLDTMVRELIDMDNQILGNLDKYSWMNPFRSYMDEKRVGFRIMDDDDGSTLKEYTVVMGEGCIEDLEDGINNVSMTKSVKKYLFEEMYTDKQNFIDKPFKTILKYWVKSPKYLKDGDLKVDFKIKK